MNQDKKVDEQVDFEIDWGVGGDTDAKQDANNNLEIAWDIEETSVVNQNPIEESYCFEIVDETTTEAQQSNLQDDKGPITESVLCDRQLRE